MDGEAVTPNDPLRRGTPGGDLALVTVAAAAVAVGLVVRFGAELAAVVSGGDVHGPPAVSLQATGSLVAAPGDPAAAWGTNASGLPGPALYWTCTAAVAIAAVASATVVLWACRRWLQRSRTRFGVPTDARVARRCDVRPLAVHRAIPPRGRMLLGRMAPRGPLLATEDLDRHAPVKRRSSTRQGDRGSVALIGPTRCGKTVLASTGIIGWDGPVVALSVKRDLYDATAPARARRGELAVFDPSGVTGLPTARWTPLRDVTTTSGALRAGRALAQAIPRQGVTGGDFWAAHGETLSSAFMALAGLSRLLPNENGGRREPLTIGRLAAWAHMHVGITDPTVNDLIREGLQDHQALEVRLLAKDAMTKLMAFEEEDPRIRASIYATARLAFEAWTEPSVAHSASLDPRATYWSDEIWDHTPRLVDLDWLMEGPTDQANTLYLTAPATEFARLAPVLGGLLGDLREQIHAWDIAGRRLPKPLLIVIDEAGQLELQWLPEEVSTIAGLGGTIVTSWQSRSQIVHRYGSLADAVLGGHRSKIVFNGTDDLATVDYLARIAGTEHVPQRSWSVDVAGGRRTVSEALSREDLIPPHVVRQMRRHEAVLLHGTLPPIHLRMVPWWRDKALSALATPDGDPSRTPRTCPVQDGERAAVTPVLDPAVVRDSVSYVPNARRPAHGRNDVRAAIRARQADGSRQPRLDFGGRTIGEPAPPTEDPTLPAPRVTCDRCGRTVPAAATTETTLNGRSVTRCYPGCSASPAGQRHS
jgi:type IV secretion system protein VirD4